MESNPCRRNSRRHWRLKRISCHHQLGYQLSLPPSSLTAVLGKLANPCTAARFANPKQPRVLRSTPHRGLADSASKESRAFFTSCTSFRAEYTMSCSREPIFRRRRLCPVVRIHRGSSMNPLAVWYYLHFYHALISSTEKRTKCILIAAGVFKGNEHVGQACRA